VIITDIPSETHPGEVKYFDSIRGRDKHVRTEPIDPSELYKWFGFRRGKNRAIIKVVRYYEADGYLYKTEYLDAEDWVHRTEYEPRSNCPK